MNDLDNVDDDDDDFGFGGQFSMRMQLNRRVELGNCRQIKKIRMSDKNEEEEEEEEFGGDEVICEVQMERQI